MIKFIKKLLGFNLGCGCTAKDNCGTTKETIKEILTPPSKAEVPAAVYIPPTKPNTVARVRAITDTNPGAVAAAITPKPANKKRRPYRGNKVKAGGAKPAVTEGNAKSNTASKPAQVAKAKPSVAKKK